MMSEVGIVTLEQPCDNIIQNSVFVVCKEPKIIMGLIWNVNISNQLFHDEASW